MRHSVLLSIAAMLLVATTSWANNRYVLDNEFLGRAVSTEGGTLRTVEIFNHRAGTSARPTSTPEFRLRLSQGTDKPDTQFAVTAKDFTVVTERASKEALVFQLENTKRQLQVEVSYELAPGDFYLRKRPATQRRQVR